MPGVSNLAYIFAGSVTKEKRFYNTGMQYKTFYGCNCYRIVVPPFHSPPGLIFVGKASSLPEYSFLQDLNLMVG